MAKAAKLSSLKDLGSVRDLILQPKPMPPKTPDKLKDLWVKNVDPKKIEAKQNDVVKTSVIIDAEYNPKDPEINHLQSKVVQGRGLIAKAIEFLNSKPVGYGSAKTLIATAYKYAPTAPIRIQLSEIRQTLTTLEKTVAKLEAKKEKLATSGQSKAEIKATTQTQRLLIIKDRKELINRLTETLPLFDSETSKLQGNFFIDLNDKFTVSLSQYNKDYHAVVSAHAPVVVGLRRPLEEDLYSADFEPEHIDSFLYVFNKARIVGFRHDAIPREYDENILRKIVQRSLGGSFQNNVCTLRMSHSTSNRVWFLVLEASFQIRTAHFADRNLSPEFDAFRTISNTAEYSEVEEALISMGFTEEMRNPILARWRSADTPRLRNAILIEALQDKKRKDRQNQQKQVRLNFEAEQAENLRTIRLLDDDYHSYTERLNELKARFGFLTSATAMPEDGLALSQYGKLALVFSKLEHSAVRGIRDPYERQLLRNANRKDRLEARNVYWEYKTLKALQSKAFHTMNALKAHVIASKEKKRSGDYE